MNYLPESWPTMKAAISTFVRRALPRTARVVRIDLLAATDGAWSVTINGEAASFVAASSTLAEIRDGLILAIQGLAGLGDVTTAAIVDGDSLSLTARDAGLDFVVVVAGPATNAITATTTVASFAWTRVWAHQRAAAPPFPYAELRVLAPPKGVGVAATTNEADGDELIQTVGLDVDFTVEIQLHARVENDDGRPASEVADTAMVAAQLEVEFGDHVALEPLANAGLAFRGVLSNRDLTGLGGQRGESRTALDVRLGARSRKQSSIAFFELPTVAVGAVGAGADTISGVVEAAEA